MRQSDIAELVQQHLITKEGAPSPAPLSVDPNPLLVPAGGSMLAIGVSMGIGVTVLLRAARTFLAKLPWIRQHFPRLTRGQWDERLSVVLEWALKVEEAVRQNASIADRLPVGAITKILIAPGGLSTLIGLRQTDVDAIVALVAGIQKGWQSGVAIMPTDRDLDGLLAQEVKLLKVAAPEASPSSESLVAALSDPTLAAQAILSPPAALQGLVDASNAGA